MAACDVEESNVHAKQSRLLDVERMPPTSPPAVKMALVNKAKQELANAKSALSACRTAHAWYDVRLHVIRMANDDGSNATVVTEANVTTWVDRANLVFAPARLRVLFDPAGDYETHNNTRLNELFEGSDAQRDIDAKADAVTLANSFADRVVVICRRSRDVPNAAPGSCGPGCGYSSGDARYIVMPPFDANIPELFGHELGHYFGLQHTFLYVLDTTNDARVLFDVLRRDLAALEGDSGFVTDTQPEIVIWDQNAGNATSVDFFGKTISFLRSNVMSYYRPLVAHEKTVSAGQVARVRSIVQSRKAGGLGVTERIV